MNKKGSTSIFLILVILLLGAGYLVNKGIIVLNLPEDFSIITTSTSVPVTSTIPDEGIEEEFCQKKGTDFKLSLSEAKKIAVLGECGDNLKDTYICNEITGTWWINLDIEKEGCNPACVINVETKMAEINWRCTGLLPM
jgi:hypothetical protein